RGAHAVALAQRVEQVHRAHDVGRIGADRVGEGVAHDRLRRQVHDDLRPAARDGAGERVGVADVADHALDVVAEGDRPEQIRIGRWGQGIAGDAGAEAREPQAEPAADEAGVTRDEDPAAAPERVLYADSRHSFQV